MLEPMTKSNVEFFFCHKIIHTIIIQNYIYMRAHTHTLNRPRHMYWNGKASLLYIEAICVWDDGSEFQLLFPHIYI